MIIRSILPSQNVGLVCVHRLSQEDDDEDHAVDRELEETAEEILGEDQFNAQAVSGGEWFRNDMYMRYILAKRPSEAVTQPPTLSTIRRNKQAKQLQ